MVSGAVESQRMKINWNNIPHTINSAGNNRVYQYVSRQPNWITRTALRVFLFILMLPVFLLLLFAVLIGMLVFGSLVLLNSIRLAITGQNGFNNSMSAGRSKYANDKNRKNVRVLNRDDS